MNAFKDVFNGIEVIAVDYSKHSDGRSDNSKDLINKNKDMIKSFKETVYLIEWQNLILIMVSILLHLTNRLIRLEADKKSFQS